jgi:hypothetical protein
MDISKILIQAQKVVDEAKISEDLRGIAFGKAVELLAQEKTPIKQFAAPATASPTAGAGEVVVEKIARKLDLSMDSTGEVYSDDGQGGVSVVIGVGKLDSSTAAATKQLALLVSGGRQLGEIEQWTSSRKIRDVCVHYGRFDPANFAKTLKQMDEAFSFKGKGHQLEIRLHQRGIERLKQLITTLTGA